MSRPRTLEPAASSPRRVLFGLVAALTAAALAWLVCAIRQEPARPAAPPAPSRAADDPAPTLAPDRPGTWVPVAGDGTPGIRPWSPARVKMPTPKKGQVAPVYGYRLGEYDPTRPGVPPNPMVPPKSNLTQEDTRVGLDDVSRPSLGGPAKRPE